MDYRQLLKKYIDHVGEYEGSTFLQDYMRSNYPDMPDFTDEEWAELKKLEDEPLDFEPPMDFNTIVYCSYDGVISHTYDPKCPQGCVGQLEGCVHKKEGIQP